MHSHRYRITIGGDVGRAGRAAFEEFNIVSNDGHTSLVADLDQPALYGALIRIQSLGLLRPQSCLGWRGGHVHSAGHPRS